MEFFTSIIDYCCKDEISDSKSILGMTFTKEGKIISVTENSIAEKSGLIMNDIIIAIAGNKIFFKNTFFLKSCSRKVFLKNIRLVLLFYLVFLFLYY